MSEPCYTMDQAAAILSIGRNELFKILRERKILNVENLPNREYREAGYLSSRQFQYNLGNSGLKKWGAKTIVTNKGMKWLGKVLNRHNQEKQHAAEERRQAAKRENYRRNEIEKQAWKTILSTPWTTNNEADSCKI